MATYSIWDYIASLPFLPKFYNRNNEAVVRDLLALESTFLSWCNVTFLMFTGIIIIGFYEEFVVKNERTTSFILFLLASFSFILAVYRYFRVIYLIERTIFTTTKKGFIVVAVITFAAIILELILTYVNL